MNEIQDMAAMVRLGMEGTYFLIKGEVKAAMALVQLIQKLYKAKVLQPGEMESLQKLLKASDGQVQFINIPTEKPELINQLKSDLDALGTTYTVMPDLNVGDGQIQIAVASKDMERVSHWYQSFCTDRLMAGGEQQYEQLMHLTQGQVDITSITIDDKNPDLIEKLHEDFQSLRINYCKMPDLNVGDGKIQIMYALADAPKLRAWYGQYQADILKETGEMLPDFEDTKMGMTEYVGTAMTDAKGYWNTAAPETKEQIGQAAVKETKPGFRTPEAAKKNFIKNTDYQAALKKPDAIDITINKKLVIDENKLVVRMPYTNQYIALPPDSVFKGADQGKTYAAVLDLNKEYPKVSQDGKKMGTIRGKDIYAHFDKTERDMSKHVTGRVQGVQKDAAKNAVHLPQNVKVSSPKIK